MTYAQQLAAEILERSRQHVDKAEKSGTIEKTILKRYLPPSAESQPARKPRGVQAIKTRWKNYRAWVTRPCPKGGKHKFVKKGKGANMRQRYQCNKCKRIYTETE